MSPTTRRFLILIASIILIVLAAGSLLATALLFRAFIFDTYNKVFLAQFTTIVFLPAMTFCLAVLTLVMLDRFSVSKAKKKK